jgi:ArsR family transcriptional regulator
MTQPDSTPAEPPATACEPHEHQPRPHKPLPVGEQAFERAAAFFRAAGDVARLKILARLTDGEWCVTELAEAAEAGISTVSQQLRLLRLERLVKRRRSGKHLYYSLIDSHIIALVREALEHAAEEQRASDSEHPDADIP